MRAEKSPSANSLPSLDPASLTALAAPFGSRRPYRLGPDSPSIPQRGARQVKHFARNLQMSLERTRKRSPIDNMVITSPDALQALIREGVRNDVRTLKLDSAQAFDDEDLACVRRCFPQLTTLDIGKGAEGVTDEGLWAIRGLNLASLRLNNAQITDQGMGVIRAMPLTSLEIGGCKKITPEVLKHLDGKAIHTLDLSGTKLNAIDPTMVLQLMNLPLEKLDLSHAYQHFSNSAHLVLRAMLDDGLVSHGTAGPEAAANYDAPSIARMKRLHAEGRIRHSASLSWTERELLRMPAKSSLLTPLYNDYAALASQVAASGGAAAAKTTIQALLLDQHKTLIPGMAKQFVERAFQVHPHIPAAIARGREISANLGETKAAAQTWAGDTARGMSARFGTGRAGPAATAERATASSQTVPSRPAAAGLAADQAADQQQTYDDPTVNMPGAWKD